MNYITLNGVSSNTITGLLIQELPPISLPKMRTEINEIDGRDGDIVTELGYSAYDKEISIGLHGSFDINQVIAFFASKGTVIFSNEPDKYYRYQVIEQIDFERLVRYRTATVKMHVQPFKYDAEETEIDEDGGEVLTGDIVSFNSVSTDPLTDVKVSLSPVQNLNGYANPWISSDNDQVPYLIRKTTDANVSDVGNHEMDTIVGGSIAWNQHTKALNSTNWTNSNFTASYSDGTATFRGTSQYGHVDNTTTPIELHHKVLMSYEIKRSSNTGSIRYVYYTQGIVPDYIAVSVPSSAGDGTTWVTYAKVADVGIYDGYGVFSIQDNRSTRDDFQVRNVVCFDLTQMFGSTIADYIYSLEQNTTGAGVAWFRALFPNDYYAYNTGELLHVNATAHVTTGFNQWDEQWEVGGINPDSGASASGAGIRTKNHIPVSPNQTYYACIVSGGSGKNLKTRWYDANKSYIGSSPSIQYNSTFTVPSNAYYLRFCPQDDYGTTYNHNICINFNKTTGTPKNGDYVAYSANTYALDSDLVLRGIPKLDASNHLYYDGDTYASDGTVTRKYGIVDLGTVEWAYSSTYNAFSTTNTGSFILRNYTAENFAFLINGYVDANWRSQDIATASDKTASNNLGTKHDLWIKDTAYTDANTFKTAMSGVYMVYELATSTTESADPYTGTQVIDADGSEEYTVTAQSGVSVPVGHKSYYANICPISGWDEANVYHTGKNLLNNRGASGSSNGITWTVNDDGSITLGGTATNIVDININTVTNLWRIGHGQMTLVCSVGADYNPQIAGLNFQSDIYVDGAYVSTLQKGNASRSFNGGVISVGLSRLRINNGTVIPNGTVFYPQIEIGTTQTAYEPYDGDTHSFTFSDTVYGGTLNVVSGVLTITHAKVTATTSNTVRNASTSFYVSVADSIRDGNAHTLLSNVFKSWNSSISTATLGICFINTAGALRFNTTSEYASVSEALSAIGELYFVYQLATPTTVSLTATEVDALLGINNIWSAEGTVEVTVPNILTVTNKGNTIARPRMTIYGSGNVNVIINGIQVFSIAMGDIGYITIDGEQMEATQGEGVLKNRLVTGDYSDFVLQSGENIIALTGNVTEVQISNYSRWL